MRATGFVGSFPSSLLSRFGTAIKKSGLQPFIGVMCCQLTFICSCREWLKRRLHLAMIAFLPLLLAATPAAPPPNAVRVASATVQIVRLEPVSASADPKDAKPADRQYRRRDTMPLVEFF